MGFSPFQNREVKENQDFDKLPEGKYEVNGIDDYFSTDKDRNLPIFVPQGDQIVVRFHLRLTSEELKRLADRGINTVQGPAMSATYSQLVLLLKAFGGDIKGLPEGETTAFLLAVQERANAAAQKQMAKVDGDKGWAKYVSGTNPDNNIIYLWKLANVVSVDKTEPVKFQSASFPGKGGGSYFQSVAYAWFELVGDMYGRSTPYDGYQFRMKIVNPFSGVDSKTGVPNQVVSKIAADRFDTFVKLFCPQTRDRNWTTDPEKSQYGVNEMDNSLMVFVKEALKTGNKALCQFKTNEHGVPMMDLLDFAPFDMPIDVDKRKQEESSQPWPLVELVELLDEVVSEKVGVKAFVDTPKDSNMILLDWTPEGLTWAKENLAGLWDGAKLPLFEGKRVLGKLSGGELVTLDRVVRKAYGKEKKPVNAALTENGSF